MAVPEAFVDALSGGVVVALGFERCASVYSADGWTDLADEVGARPATDASTRNLARFVFASANEQSLDRQHRLELPGLIRTYAGITRDVVVIGAGRAIEIWDADSWAAVLAGLQDVTFDTTDAESPAAD